MGKFSTYIAAKMTSDFSVYQKQGNDTGLSQQLSDQIVYGGLENRPK